MDILLIVFHVTCAAILFGLPLGLPGACRRAMAVNQGALQLAAAEAVRKGKILAGASLLTLLTGVLLIISKMGGFGAAPKNFHVALLLMIVAMVVSIGVIRPAAANLLVAAGGDTVEEDLANQSLKRMAMGSGILQLMWIGMLSLMFITL